MEDGARSKGCAPLFCKNLDFSLKIWYNTTSLNILNMEKEYSIVYAVAASGKLLFWKKLYTSAQGRKSWLTKLQKKFFNIKNQKAQDKCVKIHSTFVNAENAETPSPDEFVNGVVVDSLDAPTTKAPRAARTFINYSDPSHAWLRVPLKDVIKFGLTNKITSYSYINGNYAYLEEDSDAPLFLETLKFNGITDYKIVDKFTDKATFVRTYDPYSPETALNAF